MQANRPRLKRIAVRLFLGSLVLCGTSGAAAVYLGPDVLIGPSFEEVHGVECQTLVKTRKRDRDGPWIRQFIAVKTDDDRVRLRTALRVAKSVQHAESAHVVQVTVIDPGGPIQMSEMRGRAIGAQVTLIPDPMNDVEKKAGTYSGFSIQGATSSDGEFHGIRLEALPEDLAAISGDFTEITGCSTEQAVMATGSDKP